MKDLEITLSGIFVSIVFINLTSGLGPMIARYYKSGKLKLNCCKVNNKSKKKKKNIFYYKNKNLKILKDII